MWRIQASSSRGERDVKSWSRYYLDNRFCGCRQESFPSWFIHADSFAIPLLVSHSAMSNKSKNVETVSKIDFHGLRHECRVYSHLFLFFLSLFFFYTFSSIRSTNTGREVRRIDQFSRHAATLKDSLDSVKSGWNKEVEPMPQWYDPSSAM